MGVCEKIDFLIFSSMGKCYSIQTAKTTRQGEYMIAAVIPIFCGNKNQHGQMKEWIFNYKGK